jgi:mannose PTS system EIID component
VTDGGGGAAPGPRERRAMFLRGFTVQGSWNYQTLIGTGLAFVLAPALKRAYRDPAALERALARHLELFNSHPYLAGVAAGAIARLEADGVAPETVARFKTALRGSLGSLGDRLVWLRWRPATVLLGLALALAGAPWWAAVGGFLLAYNALHLWLRAWGLKVGLRDGLNIGATLRKAPFETLGERAAAAGAFLAGFASLAALGGTAGESAGPLAWALGVAAAAAGVALGRNVRLAAIAVLAAVLVAGLVVGNG